MELIRKNVGSQKVVVSPLSDFQWSGASGPTAYDHIKRHIERAMKQNAWFVGLGDYIDFLSPSNRQRLIAAALYDTAAQVIEDQAHTLVEELFEQLLKPTKGRWLGMLEGHHYYEGQGETSDMWLAKMLDAPFIGTSAYIRLEPCNVTLWIHHGQGNSVLPSGPINKLYHVSHGLVGADVYIIGHSTKMSAVRLSRPRPKWDGAKPDLIHDDIFLVNAGGFSKSNIVGHRRGQIARGDYAEVKMLTPSPLAAPFIHIDGMQKYDRIRVEI